MALLRDVYLTLEDIVGKEHISEEPAILDSYCKQFGSTMYTGKQFMLRPEAVILPGSTEEVQEIVRACNKYGVKYKALSTGFGPFTASAQEGMLQIDLRRMNRIVEINEKHMYAVVEPYVISARLQAALMKRKLICNVIGAGATTSGLPSAGHVGVGQLGVTTSYSERNILGVEWVTPTGEIVRLGALGSTDKWFCGDGPGPSLRGILRGSVSAMGGMGVVTKAATKVYHWPGPQVTKINGRSPDFDPQLPETFKVHYPCFPSWKELTEAQYRLSESEVAFGLPRLAPWMMAASMAESNDEAVELFSKIRKEIEGPGFMVIIAAESQREFTYKEKVLNQIVSEMDGKFLPRVEDPQFGRKLMWRIIRATNPIREVFRPLGTFFGVFGAMDSLPVSVNLMQITADAKKKYIESGQFVDIQADTAWAGMYEHGHFGHLEQLALFSPSDPESMKALEEFIGLGFKAGVEEHLGTTSGVMGDEVHDLFGPASCNYHLWLRKIKKALDPNVLSESTFYITPKE